MRMRASQGLLMQEQETAVEIFFPLIGVIALVSIMEDGASVESALIGREGTVWRLLG